MQVQYILCINFFHDTSETLIFYYTISHVMGSSDFLKTIQNMDLKVHLSDKLTVFLGSLQIKIQLYDCDHELNSYPVAIAT